MNQSVWLHHVCGRQPCEVCTRSRQERRLILQPVLPVYNRQQRRAARKTRQRDRFERTAV